MSKNSGFLKDNFASRVGPKLAVGALVLTTMLAPLGSKLAPIFGGSTAHAQDSNQMAMLQSNPPAQQVSHPPAQNLPTPAPEEIDTSKPWTSKAAYRASTGKIVLHYGEGIELADLLAEGLTERGYPTIAVPGGPKEQIEMFLDRNIPGKYNQHDLDSGTLGMHAIRFFNEFVKKTPDPNTLSLAK